MEFIKTDIPDVIIIQPKVYKDDRGYFFESYNKKKLDQVLGDVNFVQDNQSKSVKGVLRGLHFQKPPFAQAKLLTCLQGEILDVAVDIRKESPTFGKYVSVKLTSENKKQLFIPRGFAHGFLVLSDTAIVSYKIDNDYAPEYDSGIIYNDKDIAIDWGQNESDFILSDKDKVQKTLKETGSPF